MTKLVDINNFLELAKNAGSCVLDVRSPGEFEQGHFSGAKNLALLNNDERHIVGLTYKEKGREEATRIGFELVGKKFVNFIDEARELSPSREVLLHCWRGGMRSNVMAWLLDMAGFKVTMLKGGYKSFRRWALEQLLHPKNIFVLAGKTGSGKTEILHHLKEAGVKVIDLEALAHHRGSTFGALGQLPQPTQEQFENNLAMQWSQIISEVWLEDESRWIGRCKLPDRIYESLRTASVLALDFSIDYRRERILNEYGKFPIEQLKERTSMLAKRLGGDRLKDSLAFLDAQDMKGWVDIMLDYYDRNYAHGISQRDPLLVALLDCSGKTINETANDLITKKNSITLSAHDY
ncbi:MAG: tRNA 2-selenouridine(34) synthase MnmH [Flavobacteriales bacterium]|nr:tRNA 2-selenouridine(34) synthase MnmH [Flavobacteriales bacterium]